MGWKFGIIIWCDHADCNRRLSFPQSAGSGSTSYLKFYVEQCGWSFKACTEGDKCLCPNHREEK